MSTTEVKQAIRNMDKYDISILNELAVKSGVSLMTVNFWYNAIKN